MVAKHPKLNRLVALDFLTTVIAKILHGHRKCLVPCQEEQRSREMKNIKRSQLSGRFFQSSSISEGDVHKDKHDCSKNQIYMKKGQIHSYIVIRMPS